MAWNDSNKNAWKGGSQTPPDLDDIVNDIKNKINNFFKSSKNKNQDSGQLKFNLLKSGFKYALIFILLIWLLSGVYIIDQAQQGVVLRFGAFQEQTNPGPHWHLPYPIETLTKVNTDRIRTAEIGYRNVGGNYSGNVSSESRMLTKDENIIDAKFAIQYKVNDAQDYLFNVANPDATLRHVVESSIRQTVGQNTMDFILTEGRVEIASKIKDRSQLLLDSYKSGLTITTVNMLDAQPPEQVQDAFNDAVKAREDKQRLINEAETYANDVLPKARGTGVRILEEARAYKSEVIAKSTGETYRFNKILTEYLQAPRVTKERLYRETMENVFGSTSKIIIDSNASSIMYLPLDKLINPEKTNINEMAKPNTNKANRSNKNRLRNILNNR